MNTNLNKLLINTTHFDNKTDSGKIVLLEKAKSMHTFQEPRGIMTTSILVMATN